MVWAYALSMRLPSVGITVRRDVEDAVAIFATDQAPCGGTEARRVDKTIGA
jgi:hypothetical protein